MTNYARRLHKLEQAIGPPTEVMHILRVIIEPNAAEDVATEVIARSEDGDRQFTRQPSETRDALCERAERAMRWKS